MSDSLQSLTEAVDNHTSGGFRVDRLPRGTYDVFVTAQCEPGVILDRTKKKAGPMLTFGVDTFKTLNHVRTKF